MRQELVQPGLGTGGTTATGVTTDEWVLTGRPGDAGNPRDFVISHFPFRVGRKHGLSLTLPRATVSGMHAELVEKNRGLWIRDLSSTNGTFVNGDRLAGEGERQLHDNDLVQFADAPFRLRRSSANPSHTRNKDACDRALALVQFDRLISGAAVIPHFQPIIDLKTNRLYAYEALARSRLVGLETPDYMFTAAAELGMTTELTQMLRRVAVTDSGLMGELPHLFLNTHPCEVADGTLLASCQELRKQSPHHRITIEIHEGAISRTGEMAELRRGLEDIDMRLAFDDFGAGQARIVELSEVRPQYVKFDRSLIRNLHTADSSRQRVVSSLVTMVLEMGIVPLAEGVELVEECAACVEAGFVLSQGYYHGKPMSTAHLIKSRLDGAG